MRECEESTTHDEVSKVSNVANESVVVKNATENLGERSAKFLEEIQPDRDHGFRAGTQLEFSGELTRDPRGIGVSS